MKRKVFGATVGVLLGLVLAMLLNACSAQQRARARDAAVRAAPVLSMVVCRAAASFDDWRADTAIRIAAAVAGHLCSDASVVRVPAASPSAEMVRSLRVGDVVDVERDRSAPESVEIYALKITRQGDRR